MPDLVWVFVTIAWVIEALTVGYLMGRRGYDAYGWTITAVALGPLAVPVAVGFVLRPPRSEPRLHRAGLRGRGSIDVLVGVDGSPESAAALSRAVALFKSTASRITLATVIPVDATAEAERLAEADLASACDAHPEFDPSTVVLRGEPVVALRDYVRARGYEVLVLGTRGSGRTKGVLGSVASRFARGAGTPVLLVDDEPELKLPLREAV